MACAELTAFRTATESLDSDIIRNPRLGRAMYWRNLIKMGEYPGNVGVTRSTFTIKSTEPVDDPTLATNITLVASQPSPTGNPPTYEDVGVGFYERTYGPKIRRFRGPIVERNQFKYQFAIDDFINDYIDEMGMHNARVWEFMLRGDIMGFGDWWVDGNKTVGPNAIATAPIAYQDVTLDQLETIAVDAINSGAGVADERGYVMDGPSGPVFPLYMDMHDVASIFRKNSSLRNDANFAAMGQGDSAYMSVWRAIGATRSIGNWRFVPTDIAPRFNFIAPGVFSAVTPFKTIDQVGTDDVILTDAYLHAPYHGAILSHPDTMVCEAVRPQAAGLSWQAIDYNGDWRFYTGGERICTPAQYDPEHELGRHFAHIEYAPKPRKIHYSKIYVYKHCSDTIDTIFCS